MTTGPVGLVLAAGAGERFGGPKALVRDQHGATWVTHAVAALVEAGVDEVFVVVGAAADQVRDAIPTGARVVEAADWRQGMGASLRAGLDAVASACPEAVAVLVQLVDTPGVGADVVRRVAAHAAPATLARAAYEGIPGHPVLLGRDHWAGVATLAEGDRGARDYLATRSVHLVECGDVGDGSDIDTPGQLRHEPP
jgi:nicotine blue oxidoreductase